MRLQRGPFVLALCVCLTLLLKGYYSSGPKGAALPTSAPMVGFLSRRSGNVTLPPALQQALLRDGWSAAEGARPTTDRAFPASTQAVSAPPTLPMAKPTTVTVDGALLLREPRPSIAVMTLVHRLDGVYTWMWPMSYHTKAVYCQRMGYDLIIGSAADVEPQRSSHWAKLTMSLRWLPHYDHIMWMDADTLVTRFNFAIDSLIVPGIDVVMARDWNNINSGVFLMRNSTSTMEFLRACLAVPLSSLAVPAWHEQAAMIHVLDRQPQYLPRFYFPPQRMLNSYPAAFAEGHDSALWRPGDFLAHTPACHGREERCRQVFNDTYQQVATMWQLPPVPRVVPVALYPKPIPRLPPLLSLGGNPHSFNDKPPPQPLPPSRP